MAQLYINRMNLPKEILFTIKDYIWYDIQIANIRKMKKDIHFTIKTAVCPNNETDDYWKGCHDRRWYFIINTHIIKYYFQCNFCKKCGNYELAMCIREHDMSNTIKCTCNYI